jgi:hypothetical protein
MSRKSKQKNLQRLLELPLKKLFLLWSKQRKQLNVWRRTILVRWKPSQALLLVWWSLVVWCWPSWNKNCLIMILMIRFGRKLKVWWTSLKSSWKECLPSMVRISSKVFLTQSTKSLKILPKSIMKRTWWVKVSQPLNSVLGQSTSWLSTEFSKKSSLCKSQKIKLRSNSSKPWNSWLKLKNKCVNSTIWSQVSDKNLTQPKTRRNWSKTTPKDVRTS